MTRFDPPPHYDQAHRTLWTQITTDLTTGGRIFAASPAVIDALVEARHTHARATALLNKTDVLVIRGDKAVENPALSVQRKSAETIARLTHALGLDRPTTNPIEPAAPAGPHGSEYGRWCESHRRRECIHDRSKGRGPCHAPAIRGTDSCPAHAGKSRARAKAEGAARLAPHREISPGLGLLEEVHRTAGMVAWLEAECAQLPADQLWRGVSRTVDRDGVREQVTETKPHVKLAALYREREHFAAVCDRALARGAEQQVIDMAKAVSGVAVKVMDQVLADLDLNDEQWARVPQVVPRAFRAITAGPGR